MTPRYAVPRAFLSKLARDMLLVRRRDFQRDSAACLASLALLPRIFGTENIPHEGPCLLTFNHFHHPDIHIWWPAMAITAQLPMGAHWVMAAEWTAPGKWYEPLKSAVSQFVASRLAQIYGFTAMPPMPPRPRDVGARAAAVRRVLSFVERTARPVVCFAPEGADMPGGRLAWPPSGAGRFMLLLAGRGLSVLPAGVWEDDRVLCLRFGPLYELNVVPRFSSGEKDREAARIVMTHIAGLLPPGLRGAFA